MITSLFDNSTSWLRTKRLRFRILSDSSCLEWILNFVYFIFLIVKQPCKSFSGRGVRANRWVENWTDDGRIRTINRHLQKTLVYPHDFSRSNLRTNAITKLWVNFKREAYIQFDSSFLILNDTVPSQAKFDTEKAQFCTPALRLSTQLQDVRHLTTFVKACRRYAIKIKLMLNGR